MAELGQQRRSGFKLEAGQFIHQANATFAGVAAHSGTSYVEHSAKLFRDPVEGDWIRVTVAGQVTGTASTKSVLVQLDGVAGIINYTMVVPAADTGSYLYELLIVFKPSAGIVYHSTKERSAGVNSVATQQASQNNVGNPITIRISTKVTAGTESISVRNSVIECGGSS